MIFPDGTSMLFDAGEAKQRENEPYYPIYPSDSLSAGAWIAFYINLVNPKDNIDYAVISHFHQDHFGYIDSTTTWSKNNEYRLSGITTVGDIIPILKILDRGYPKYEYPFPLLGKENSSLDNYFDFINAKIKSESLIAEAIIPGVNNQIVLNKDSINYSTFEVRNVKSNQWIWKDKNDELLEFKFNPPLVNEEGYYNENPLSICLKVSYGDFDYFTGGDLPGVNNYPDYDIETVIADVVGEVDALSLNHHGYHDASNEYFLSTLMPQVAVHQSIHDPHFQENVISNLINQSIPTFAIHSSDDMKDNLKEMMSQIYKSQNGHVLLRVKPDGKSFMVYILEYDDKLQLEISKRFGPYCSN